MKTKGKEKKRTDKAKAEWLGYENFDELMNTEREV